MIQLKRIAIAILLVSSLLLSGCITSSGPDMTVLEALDEAGEFTQLLSMLESSGLDSTLEGEGPYTLFAPTDMAFDNVDDSMMSLLGSDPELLSQVLSYLMHEGMLSKADVSKSGTITTLQGEEISVTTSGEVKVNDSALGIVDTECTNGWIHSIVDVIFPPTVSEKVIDLTFEDGLGKEIYLAETPERIVSLASSATEVLFTIGAGELVVGRDKYSTIPAEVESVTNVGSSYSLAVDKVVELDPDLVIVWYYSTGAIETLEGLGLTVMAINPQSIQDVNDMIALFGQITGHSQEASSVSDTIQSTIDSITGFTATLEEQEKVKVYYELSTAYKSPNNTTITGEMITLAGGVNIAGEQESTYTVLASEWIIQQDPDIIVVVSYGASAEEIKSREGWDSISAVQNDKVFAIDTNWATSNTLIWKGLEQFSKWFYPEQFE